jgi:NADPH-dependent glutamate synthase beta subunit-like oxidoreductase
MFREPLRGREAEYPENRVPLAAEKKKVAVIGGGPAGVQAMLTLVERGHDVTLYEREAQIGGNLRYASLDPRKKDVKQFLTYLQNQAKVTAGADEHRGDTGNAQKGRLRRDHCSCRFDAD